MNPLRTNHGRWWKLWWQRYPLIALVVRILVYLWGWRCTRDLVYKCARSQNMLSKERKRQGKKGFGGISLDIKVKRSETRLAGTTFRRLHLRLERNLRGAKLKERSKKTLSSLTTLLSPCIFSPMTPRSQPLSFTPVYLLTPWWRWWCKV